MTADNPEPAELIERLDVSSVMELSDTGWSNGALLAVVRADTVTRRARLNACEILLRRDQERFLASIGEQKVAALYAAALREGTTTDLNSWAYLGMDDLGPIGLHLVACGESAVTAVAPLLDIKQSAGIYSGSKEAKLGDSDRARICDFAALFIARIRQLPYAFHRGNIELRDAEIGRLRELVSGK